MNTVPIYHFCVIIVIVYLSGMAESTPRPHLRSNLARTVYDRMMNDERLRTMDLSKMYGVDELALEDGVRGCFIQMSCDEDTQKFLDTCFEQSEWLITQVWHAVAKSLLGIFMSQTSVNGLLGRGRMFVWSEDQANRLLNPNVHNQQSGRDAGVGMKLENEKVDKDDAAPDRNEVIYGQRDEMRSLDTGEREDGAHEEAKIGDGPSFWVGDRLLDLGAGDGHVTKVLAAGARHVDVTEASPVMRKCLRDMGYRVLDTWKWMQETEGIQYDVITALNLLDRCDTPKTLLKDIHRKLADNGSLVVAVVLPFTPYVEIGSADNLPSESLGISGSTTEEQVNSLATEVFPSLGFQLSRWTRLPYLCEGDLDQAFYWLSDVVLVLGKENGTSSDKAPLKMGSKEEDIVNDTKIEL